MLQEKRSTRSREIEPTVGWSSVHDPFKEHEEAEVTEERPEEEDFRHKLEQDFVVFLEMDVVPQSENDTEAHVNNSNDDGQFHLEGIQEDDLILCVDPNGIDAERVRGLGVLAGFVFGVQHEHFFCLQRFFWNVGSPRRPENVKGAREGVIVDEARVNGENAHHDDDVTAAEDDPKHLHCQLSHFFFHFFINFWNGLVDSLSLLSVLLFGSIVGGWNEAEIELWQQKMPTDSSGNDLASLCWFDLN